MLDDLVAVIETLKVRIQQHQGSLQSNEIRTRTALIDPLLTALGWDVADPNLVTPEYDVSGKRADYGLLKKDGKPRSCSGSQEAGRTLGSSSKPNGRLLCRNRCPLCWFDRWGPLGNVRRIQTDALRR